MSEGAAGDPDRAGAGVLASQDRDEQALARFEMLAVCQPPVLKPWQPVTDYSWEAREPIERWHAQLIEDAFHPTQALDVGCGPGHLVRLLGDLGVNVRGVDKEGEDEFYIDIGEPPHLLHRGGNCGDLVICREVLEHLTLRELRNAVTNLCRLSSRYVYLTTRFAKDPKSLLSVDTSDDLDPTHITMLNQTFLRALIVLEGFHRRADLEAKLDWMKKGRVLVYERA